jgi:hypothetical protein
MSCISAAGNKLPLFFVPRGKTPWCNSQIGEHSDHLFAVSHTDNGWFNENLMY